MLPGDFRLASAPNPFWELVRASSLLAMRDGSIRPYSLLFFDLEDRSKPSATRIMINGEGRVNASYTRPAAQLRGRHHAHSDLLPPVESEFIPPMCVRSSDVFRTNAPPHPFSLQKRLPSENRNAGVCGPSATIYLLCLSLSFHPRIHTHAHTHTSFIPTHRHKSLTCTLNGLVEKRKRKAKDAVGFRQQLGMHCP